MIFGNKKNNTIMNENLDLVEILKDCPKGTRLYSVIYGDVEFSYVDESSLYPIKFNTGKCTYRASSYGRHDIRYGGECTLFPSKDQHDWSKFKVPDEKFDYSTLHPFDKVLVRCDDKDVWKCGLFSCMDKDWMFCECSWEQGIPYNVETKHLAGTTDKPDKKYIWWEE